MSDPRTLHRQWSMLRMIPRHPRKTTASELIAWLDDLGYSVEKRTVERDLKMLESLFGLEVDDRSRPHGWCWSADSTGLDLRALSEEEALMLTIAENIVQPMLPSGVAGELHPVFVAARKLLKETVGSRRLKAWMAKIAFDPPTQPLLPAKVTSGVRTEVVRALFIDQWLRISYRKLDAVELIELEIAPLGLVTRGPMLYLVCSIRGQDGYRTIALNRIVQAMCLDERVKPPSDFSLRTFVDQGKLGFGGSTTMGVCLRVCPHLAQLLTETPLAVDQELATEQSGSVIIRARIPVTPQLKRWILSQGDDIEVVEPQQLRQDIIRVTRSVAERYSIDSKAKDSSL